MSCVIVLTPVVVAAWPVLAAAVASAAVAAGFRVVKDPKKAAARPKEAVDIEIENADVVGESLRADQQIAVEREGVRVVFSRDARGRLRTCVEGDLGKAALRQIGEDLAGRVVQQYVHRRLAEELANQGFTTVAEERGPDESIRLHVRRYEG